MSLQKGIIQNIMKASSRHHQGIFKSVFNKTVLMISWRHYNSIFENASNKIFFIMLLSCHYYAIIIPSLCFLKFVFLYKNQRCHYDAIMALLKWHYNVLSTKNAIITF